MKSKPDRSAVTETLKTILAVLLFAGMLLQTGVFIVLSRRTTVNQNEIDMASLLFFTSDSEADDTETIRFMLRPMPAFFGYRIRTASRALIGNQEIMEYVTEKFDPVFSAFLTENARCVVYEENEGSLLWKRCLTAEEAVYFRFPEAVLSSFFAAYSPSTPSDSTSFDPGPEGEILMLKELFFVRLTAGTAFRLIARDIQGRVAEYRTDAPLTADISWLLAYNDNKAFFPFRFCESGAAVPDLVLAGSVPFSEETAASRPISISVPVLTEDENLQSEIGRLVGFSVPMEPADGQPEGAAGMENEKTFRAQGGTLSFSSDGEIRFAAGSAAPALSEYLGYVNTDGTYSLKEKITAGTALASRIAGLNSGEAEMRLLSLDYDDPILTLRYAYWYDNILLTDEDGQPLPAFSVSVSEREIRAFTVKLLTLEPGSGRFPGISLAYALRSLASDFVSGSRRVTGVLPVYRIPSDPAGEPLYTSWLFSAEPSEKMTEKEAAGT